MKLWFFLTLLAVNLISIGFSTASLVKTWRNNGPIPKLCPRCGTRPGLRRVGDHRDLWACTCMECGYTPAKNGEARSTVRGAVKVWNRRADHGDP